MSSRYVQKKTQNKSNKIINVVIIIVIILLISALAIMVSKNTENVKNDQRIVEISYSEYEEKSKTDEYMIILLTTPSCGHCANYKPMVNYAANEYDLDVYNIDVSSRDLTIDQFNYLHNFSAVKNQYDSDGNAVIPTPTTVIVQGGVEVASKSGDIGYDGFINFLTDNSVINKK